MTASASGVDFDRSRLSQGEMIAGIAGLVLLIDLWFKWYGIKVSGAGGVLKSFSVGVSANAWEAFGFIDILLFLIALIAIGVAVLRAIDRMPEMPYPPATLVAGAGGLAVLLILFRTVDTPIDTHGLPGIDVTRGIGLWLGLLAAAGITYGGWRAMQEGPGATFTRPVGAGGAPVSPTAPTTAMPADSPGVPGGGAAGVSPGKEGPGVPHPGTSTGGPDDAEGDAPPPAAAAADPVPGSTAPQTPPGIAGEPPASEGTHPPGL